MQNLDELSSEILSAVEAADTTDALEAVRIDALGKKGRISLMMRELGGMDPEERKVAGQTLNKVKDGIAAAIETRQAALSRAALDARLAAEAVDVSLPSRPETEARLHPLSRTIEEVVAIFAEMGFTVAEGPDIESDYYNFTALNIPEQHPARQEHDTFYLPPDDEGRRKVLRTHTSPVQIRTMVNEEPPIRIVAPGRVYRCDSDLTHTPMFHQIEGLVVDRDISFADLKGTIITFLNRFFEADLDVRFRPSYFPFTEPSAEVDVQCVMCEGAGCRVCSHTGWLEVMGCGMVHPKVFEQTGVDTSVYTGFAFGMGIERLAMLRYGIGDLRLFYENDLQFLNQFHG